MVGCTHVGAGRAERVAAQVRGVVHMLRHRTAERRPHGAAGAVGAAAVHQCAEPAGTTVEVTIAGRRSVTRAILANALGFVGHARTTRRAKHCVEITTLCRRTVLGDGMAGLRADAEIVEILKRRRHERANPVDARVRSLATDRSTHAIAALRAGDAIVVAAGQTGGTRGAGTVQINRFIDTTHLATL